MFRINAAGDRRGRAIAARRSREYDAPRGSVFAFVALPGQLSEVVYQIFQQWITPTWSGVKVNRELEVEESGVLKGGSQLLCMCVFVGGGSFGLGCSRGVIIDEGERRD